MIFICDIVTSTHAVSSCRDYQSPMSTHYHYDCHHPPNVNSLSHNFNIYIIMSLNLLNNIEIADVFKFCLYFQIYMHRQIIKMGFFSTWKKFDYFISICCHNR